jgi:hypothetical protein
MSTREGKARLTMTMKIGVRMWLMKVSAVAKLRVGKAK